MRMILATVILLNCIDKLQSVERQTIYPLTLPGSSSGSCAPLKARQTAIEKLRNEIKKSIAVTQTECGDGLWYHIASLDMKQPGEQCPVGWREYTEKPVTACRRPTSSSSSCATALYASIRPYSKVCGRVIGYQVGSTHGIFTNRTVEHNYVDGVSITFGRNPRQHIWTYAAGLTENPTFSRRRNCPCSNSSGREPPEFVGTDYYCESANPTDMFDNPGFLYSSDKLWDGQQCSNEGTCCNSQSLPWFMVTLPQITSYHIEVRICGNNSTDIAGTPVEQLDIYIQ